MNKRAWVIISILVLVLTLFVASIVGAFRDHYAFSQVERLFEEQTSIYLREIAETERNDLLQENYRLIRNRFSALQADGLFSEYAIIKGEELVEHSSDYLKLADSADYLRTSINVEFSHESGKPWGKVDFLTSRKRLRGMYKSLNATLLFASLAISLFAVAGVASLLWTFWISGSSLSQHISRQLAGSGSVGSRLMSWFWMPLFNTTAKIIDDYKRASKSLEQSRVEAEMGRLAAQVAHDIRSPLSALRLGIAKPGEESRKITTMAIDRIEAIAADLLKVRRLSAAGNSNPHFENFPSVSGRPSDEQTEVGKVSEQIDAVQIVSSLIQEKKLATDEGIRIEMSSSVNSALVNFDATELGRILSNLINNSLEAVPPSGGSVQVAVRQYGGSVVIAVQDNGAGIPETALCKIRAGESVSVNKIDGNGLGLSHARSAMRRYSGRLDINSRVGEGTIVSLVFPT